MLQTTDPVILSCAPPTSSTQLIQCCFKACSAVMFVQATLFSGYVTTVVATQLAKLTALFLAFDQPGCGTSYMMTDAFGSSTRAQCTATVVNSTAFPALCCTGKSPPRPPPPWQSPPPPPNQSSAPPPHH